ncbi:hypothetical protein GCM10009646_31410 [Streptomyces aureus]
MAHPDEADGGRGDDAEGEQRDIHEGELGAQGVEPPAPAGRLPASAMDPLASATKALTRAPHPVHAPPASPYPTPRRVVINGGPSASSLRRR